MNHPIIRLQGVSKHYKNKIAVDNLSLNIQKGEIFGLLGPNGAGKTTTILMLLGLVEPTSGHVYVCDHEVTRNPIRIKQRVGYLPDSLGFYFNMTALENLTFIGRLNGLSVTEADSKAKELLELVGLKDNIFQKAGSFSRGMKQRLGLAEVLIKAPEVIILDEPTLGIDPTGVQEFLTLIKSLNKEQHLTVLLSSHHLHHVQQICDRVGIFVDGKLLAKGDITSLSKQLFNKQGHVTVLKFEHENHNIQEIIKEIAGFPNIQEVNIINDSLEIISISDQTADIVRRVILKGHNVIGVLQKQYGLDEIYLEYFKKEKKQEAQNEKSKRIFKKAFFRK